MPRVTRRAALTLLAATGTLVLGAARADDLIEAAKKLKPGQFTWHPERSPAGPVAIVVSIPDQRVHVYRNGIRIAVSTCSTGKKGHETPAGVFLILQKDKSHRSSTYNNAPMPNMNRLTWSGIALHAGNLPGYPASHGCVRLPPKFSELLFTVTHVGTPVILAGSRTDPKEVVHPGLVLGDYAEHEMEAVKVGLKGKADPWAATTDDDDVKATAVIISHADKSAHVLENGAVVAKGLATITHPEEPLGRHVFMLIGARDGGRKMAWHAFAHHDKAAADLDDPEAAVLKRIRVDDTVRKAMQARMHPGMVLVTTELPAQPDTRTGDDFVLLNTEDS
ncbi:MAG: L,D-transpeptidase [Hyphomicrobiaceae bacterium]